MATVLERLGALLTVTQQLSDFPPEGASANAQRSYGLWIADLAPVAFDANDGEVARWVQGSVASQVFARVGISCCRRTWPSVVPPSLDMLIPRLLPL